MIKISKLTIKEYETLVNAVEQYCKRFQEKCESEGKGTQYRTIREVSSRFKLMVADIEHIIEDSDNLDCLVGFRTHSGFGEFEFKGEFQVEYIV